MMIEGVHLVAEDEGRIRLVWPADAPSAVLVSQEVMQGYVDRINGLIGEVLDAQRTADELRVTAIEMASAFSTLVVVLASQRGVLLSEMALMLPTEPTRRVARMLGLDAERETATVDPSGPHSAAWSRAVGL